MIRGYHAGGLACCVKHFAAYGAAESGRDYNLADMSEHTLREYYLRAYHECLKEQPEMIMTAFNSLNGIPATANKHLLVDILRKEWGFDGVVITDYNAVLEMVAHRYQPNRREAAKAALCAGVDVEMCSSTFVENGETLVKDGDIDQERLNESVRRILKLKDKYGLFENPYYRLQKTPAAVNGDGRDLARKMAEETLVLLKNDGVLPLKKDEKIALIGPFAFSKEIIGNWCAFAEKDATVTLKDGLENLLGREIEWAKGCEAGWNETEESGVEAAVETAKRADKILLCVGEPQTECGECKSKTDIRLSRLQRRLIEQIHRLNKPVVGIVFAGRPLVLTDVVEKFDGLLYAWHPGTEGGNAIARVLCGVVNPSGKLPMSFPRSVGQCPIYYNHFSTGRPQPTDAGFFVGTSCYIDQRNSPLFAFGYGLSYTSFEISEPKLSCSTLRRGERVFVRVKVKNTGKVDGAEVVQIYIRDDFSSLVRPVKELKGFERVFLRAGEEREVCFSIDEQTLSYYGENDQLIAENGSFTVFVGRDSQDVRSCELQLI